MTREELDNLNNTLIGGEGKVNKFRHMGQNNAMADYVDSQVGAMEDRLIKTIFVVAVETSLLTHELFYEREVVKIEGAGSTYILEEDFHKVGESEEEQHVSDTVEMESERELIPGKKYLVTLS